MVTNLNLFILIGHPQVKRTIKKKTQINVFTTTTILSLKYLKKKTVAPYFIINVIHSLQLTLSWFTIDST